MNETASVLARAVSDGQDRFVSADEPLASLQSSCGGKLPGAIAIPELLELVRKARTHRFPLARSINAQDNAESITAWVEVEPRTGSDEDDGCDIILRSWRSSALSTEDPQGSLDRRAALDREVAELSARLDGERRILGVISDAADLRDLAEAMRLGCGLPFTEFVAPEGTAAHLLHWRMLDGAPVRVAGSDRPWRIVLLPAARPGCEPHGFELLLVSDEPPAVPEQRRTAASEGTQGDDHRIVGADLAPVLRQPIARIVANAETIRSRLAGPLPDAYADYAGEIASAGRLLLGLLEDLSDLEVVEATGFTTAREPVDLAEVSRQAAGILNVRAGEKAITVVVPASGENLIAAAEFRRVLQVLLNLIGNAIRYSPEGSQIEIAVERGETARVIVGDQGPGLAPEDQALVFDKFERLGRSGDGGSGLGLYISRRLARAMAGELTVRSVAGEGACFILELPLWSEEDRAGG